MEAELRRLKGESNPDPSFLNESDNPWLHLAVFEKLRPQEIFLKAVTWSPSINFTLNAQLFP
jgi:hypothetical protein